MGNRKASGKHCWVKGIACGNYIGDEPCETCSGHHSRRKPEDKPQGTSMFEMWMGAEIAMYQMRIGGNIHPRQIIEAFEHSLKGWKWDYGEHGIEKEPKWCDWDGWYCECGK